jgi:hypothetical protein
MVGYFPTCCWGWAVDTLRAKLVLPTTWRLWRGEIGALGDGGEIGASPGQPEPTALENFGWLPGSFSTFEWALVGAPIHPSIHPSFFLFLSHRSLQRRHQTTCKAHISSRGATNPLVRQLWILRHMLVSAGGSGLSEIPGSSHVAALCKSLLSERMQEENQKCLHTFRCCS